LIVLKYDGFGSAIRSKIAALLSLDRQPSFRPCHRNRGQLKKSLAA
jgi:hypothetical protein